MMIAKLRGGYLYFFLGFGAILIIFTFSSHSSVTPRNTDNFHAELLNISVSNHTDSGSNDTVIDIRDIINCSDIVLEKNVVQRGNFVVLQNFILADRQFTCDESITLTSPGDYRFLDNIVPLVQRWKGPVSVALYSPGFDFYTTLQCIAYLRTCKSPLIREYVTFHLFFENQHFPNKSLSMSPLINIYKDTFDCNMKPPYETLKHEDMYKEKHGLTYPINVARNVAKLNAQTYFVFPSDIELYPTRDFIEKFFDFLTKNPSLLRRKSNVFVLPIFEVLADQRVPENKTRLQQMFKQKKAIMFHKNVCSPCHKVPDGDKWMKANETKGLGVFSEGKREGKYAVWEPFFVCTQDEPLWDERLNWEGQGNKMCQAYTMCVLNYKFLVLDNAFLIHKPGIKKKKVQVMKHMDETKKNNKILRKIQVELQQVYGQNKKCRIHNV